MKATVNILILTLLFSGSSNLARSQVSQSDQEQCSKVVEAIISNAPLAACNSIIEKSPGNVDALLNRAEIYTIKNDFVKALNDIDTANKQNNQLGKPHYLMARIFVFEKKNDLALTEFNTAIEKGFKEPDVYYERGRFLLKQRQYEKAIGDFDEVLNHRSVRRSDYLYLDSLYSKAVALRGSKNPEKALTLTDELLSIKPDSQNAVFLRGVIYEDLGDYAKAIDSFNLAENMGMSDKQLYSSRSFVFEKMGNLNAALKDLKIYDKMDPNDDNKRLIADLEMRLAISKMPVDRLAPSDIVTTFKCDELISGKSIEIAIVKIGDIYSVFEDGVRIRIIKIEKDGIQYPFGSDYQNMVPLRELDFKRRYLTIKYTERDTGIIKHLINYKCSTIDERKAKKAKVEPAIINYLIKIDKNPQSLTSEQLSRLSNFAAKTMLFGSVFRNSGPDGILDILNNCYSTAVDLGEMKLIISCYVFDRTFMSEAYRVTKQKQTKVADVRLENVAKQVGITNEKIVKQLKKEADANWKAAEAWGNKLDAKVRGDCFELGYGMGSCQ